MERAKAVTALLTMMFSWISSWCNLVNIFQTQHRVCQGLLFAAMLTTKLNDGVREIRKQLGLLYGCRKSVRKPMRFLIRPGRTSAWWQNFVKNRVVPEEWKENFKMSCESFLELCDEVRPLLKRQVTNMRQPLSVETQVGIALYYLSDEGRYRKVANAFGVSRATVSVTVRRVCHVIAREMGPRYIKLPTSVVEVEHLTYGFFKHHGFPQCIGAVDGTHIFIRQPSVNPTDFLNRKNRCSYNVQAVCDFRLFSLTL